MDIKKTSRRGILTVLSSVAVGGLSLLAIGSGSQKNLASDLSNEQFAHLLQKANLFKLPNNFQAVLNNYIEFRSSKNSFAQQCKAYLTNIFSGGKIEERVVVYNQRFIADFTSKLTKEERRLLAQFVSSNPEVASSVIGKLHAAQKENYNALLVSIDDEIYNASANFKA